MTVQTLASKQLNEAHWKLSSGVHHILGFTKQSNEGFLFQLGSPIVDLRQPVLCNQLITWTTSCRIWMSADSAPAHALSSSLNILGESLAAMQQVVGGSLVRYDQFPLQIQAAFGHRPPRIRRPFQQPLQFDSVSFLHRLVDLFYLFDSFCLVQLSDFEEI